ncbi:hypothetical protein CYMTET_49572 [Cymbomonas tetramitiformis]|uniref:Uncharacterized protein n=1 Tax=Cymbomonas tetramitiformis TaxID=36881 RepID=A0AAE0EVN8_9CHLO|nr:hypothetical protein CYMTET_49572 [Cymbomonas tetramitiformis]
MLASKPEVVVATPPATSSLSAVAMRATEVERCQTDAMLVTGREISAEDAQCLTYFKQLLRDGSVKFESKELVLCASPSPKRPGEASAVDSEAKKSKTQAL